MSQSQNKIPSFSDKYFISYAQNYEDVYLWRLFKDIDKGYYIDVGGFDPVKHSVTKVLYDHGWHGINIEPYENFYNNFVKQRPRDINLNLAASNAQGETEMSCFFGLNSIDPNFVEKYLDRFEQKQTHTVKLDTLNNILTNSPPPTDIHFLKIDVEGHEKQVLEGIDLTKYRPWLVIFEHHLYNQHFEKIKNNTELKEIQNYLTKHDYQFAFHDGANHYYLASEKIELKKYFKLPMNILDEVLLYREVGLRQSLDEIQSILEESELLNKTQIDALKSKIQNTKNQYPLPPLFADTGWSFDE